MSVDLSGSAKRSGCVFRFVRFNFFGGQKRRSEMSISIPSNTLPLEYRFTSKAGNCPGVYFLFKGSQLLYIGYASCLASRLRDYNPKIYSGFSAIKCRNSFAAHAMEVRAIYEMRPPHNRQILVPEKHLPGLRDRLDLAQKRFRARFIKKMKDQEKRNRTAIKRFKNKRWL